MLEESRDFIWGLILQTQENWTRHGALSRKHFSFRIRLQQFYAPYGRSNAKESLNWPKRDYFYGSHWSLPPKGNESQNKWSNENTGTPSYAEWTPELKNRKGWYIKSVCWWLMNYSTLLLVFPFILAKYILSLEFKWFYIPSYASYMAVISKFMRTPLLRRSLLQLAEIFSGCQKACKFRNCTSRAHQLTRNKVACNSIWF